MQSLFCITANWTDGNSVHQHDHVLVPKSLCGNCGAFDQHQTVLPETFQPILVGETLTLKHNSGDSEQNFSFSRHVPCSLTEISYEVFPIRYYNGGDTLHLCMCQARMGFAPSKCVFCESNNSTDHPCSFLNQRYSGKPITNETILDARRLIELSEAIAREQSGKAVDGDEAYNIAEMSKEDRAKVVLDAKEQYKRIGAVKAAMPLLFPSIPMAKMLHIFKMRRLANTKEVKDALRESFTRTKRNFSAKTLEKKAQKEAEKLGLKTERLTTTFTALIECDNYTFGDDVEEEEDEDDE